MERFFLRVLGSSGWLPTKGNDFSCYTIDDHILFDACATVVDRLLCADVEPTSVHHLFFSHIHADHYMGLASLLLYWRVKMRGDLGALSIYGPKETLRDVYERALSYVFRGEENAAKSISQPPALVELEGNSAFDLPGYHVEVMPSDHSAPGLCYRVWESAAGRSVGLTGDTRYVAGFPEFFRNADMLVHECSYGAAPVDARTDERARHSCAIDAANVCEQSGAKMLLLTHSHESNREAALAAARARVGVPVLWAMPGQVFSIGAAETN